MLTTDLHGRTLPAAFEGIADSLTNPIQRNGTPHISRHTKPGDRRFPIEHMPSAHLNPPPTLERLYAAQGGRPRHIRLTRPRAACMHVVRLWDDIQLPRYPFQASRWLRFECADVAGTWGPSMPAFHPLSLNPSHANYSRTLNSFGFHLSPSNNPPCFDDPVSATMVLEACFPHPWP